MAVTWFYTVVPDVAVAAACSGQRSDDEMSGLLNGLVQNGLRWTPSSARCMKATHTCACCCACCFDSKA